MLSKQKNCQKYKKNFNKKNDEKVRGREKIKKK